MTVQNAYIILFCRILKYLLSYIETKLRPEV